MNKQDSWAFCLGSFEPRDASFLPFWGSLSPEDLVSPLSRPRNLVSRVMVRNTSDLGPF